MNRSEYESNPLHCMECNNKITQEQRRNIFCNSSCAASYNNKYRIRKEKQEQPCLYCGRPINDSKNEYCSGNCHKRYMHLIYINKQQLGLVDGSKAGGRVSRHIHNWFREKYNNKCSLCGWCVPNPYINKVILELDHIDGDSNNNKELNLQLICCNCHTLTPNYKSLNKGSGDKSRLEYSKLV